MAKYLKRDSDLGYIEDSAKIEYLKLNNLRHTILGCMLGDFDEQGYYVVSAEIQKELLSMKKFLVKTMDNIEICRGEVMLNKPITFMVTFEADRATLSLVERLSYEANLEIDSGTYSNVNEFILDEVETAGEIDRNKIYKMWNIYPMGGDVLDISKMDEETLALFSGIANRYKYLLFANKMMLEKENELEEYSLNMLNILKKYPKLKELVDAEIKTDLKDKKEFIRIDKPNFAKTFNEVLDQAIEGNNNVLTEEETAAFEQESRAVLQTRNIAMQEKLDIKTQTVLEEESNQTELDEELFADRSFKKLELDTKGQENNWSIEELFNDFSAAEQKITAGRIANAIGIAAAIAGKVVAGANSILNDFIGQISENYAPVGSLIGEETAAQIDATAGKKVEASDNQTEKINEKNAEQNNETKPKKANPEVKKQNNASRGSNNRNSGRTKNNGGTSSQQNGTNQTDSYRYSGSTGSGGLISQITGGTISSNNGADPYGKAGETTSNGSSASAQADGNYRSVSYNLGVEYGEGYVAGSTSVSPSSADNTLNP